MSVLLTAARKGIDKEKKRARSARLGSAAAAAAASARSARAPEAHDRRVSSDNVMVWRWLMGDEPVTVIFRKDTMQLWVNERPEEPMCHFDDEGAALDFIIGDQKARIRSVHAPTTATTGSPLAAAARSLVAHQLLVNGYEIPPERL